MTALRRPTRTPHWLVPATSGCSRASALERAFPRGSHWKPQLTLAVRWPAAEPESLRVPIEGLPGAWARARRSCVVSPGPSARQPGGMTSVPRKLRTPRVAARSLNSATQGPNSMTSGLNRHGHQLPPLRTAAADAAACIAAGLVAQWAPDVLHQRHGRCTGPQGVLRPLRWRRRTQPTVPPGDDGQGACLRLTAGASGSPSHPTAGSRVCWGSVSSASEACTACKPSSSSCALH